MAMGSHLGLTLANLSMGHREKVWLDSSESHSVRFYRRYVDDIFCVFENESDAITFLYFLNSRHPNLQFTTLLRCFGRTLGKRHHQSFQEKHVCRTADEFFIVSILFHIRKVWSVR